MLVGMFAIDPINRLSIEQVCQRLDELSADALMRDAAPAVVERRQPTPLAQPDAAAALTATATAAAQAVKGACGEPGRRGAP